MRSGESESERDGSGVSWRTCLWAGLVLAQGASQSLGLEKREIVPLTNYISQTSICCRLSPSRHDKLRSSVSPPNSSYLLLVSLAACDEIHHP